ncbi:hypothetical protein A2U01_0063100, partial [Trifolium medium]|nr:hypothetical protein [Trifolium medium]
PQNAGEHRSNSKQPSPPKTHETPQENVDQDDQEKPVHTSLNESEVGLKQDEPLADPEVPVQVLASNNIVTGQENPQGPILIEVQGDDQKLEDVNVVVNNNDIEADGGGDQPLD